MPWNCRGSTHLVRCTFEDVVHSFHIRSTRPKHDLVVLPPQTGRICALPLSQPRFLGGHECVYDRLSQPTSPDKQFLDQPSNPFRLWVVRRPDHPRRINRNPKGRLGSKVMSFSNFIFTITDSLAPCCVLGMPGWIDARLIPHPSYYFGYSEYSITTPSRSSKEKSRITRELAPMLSIAFDETRGAHALEVM